MPSRLPSTSTSAPPELPGLMAASVWMKFSKVFESQVVAFQRADDAHGHGLADAKRIADGEHDIADVRLVGLPESDGGQIVADSPP